MNIRLFVIVLLISLSSASITRAEYLKEGSGEYTGEIQGTSKVIDMGGGRYQTTWDILGVITSAPIGSPFYNAKSHFIGTTHIDGDSFKGNGGGVFTTPTGDTFYGTMVAEGTVSGGIKGGIIKILGGSGECVYMKGEMVLLPRPPSIVDEETGKFHGLSIGKLKWKMF